MWLFRYPTSATACACCLRCGRLSIFSSGPWKASICRQSGSVAIFDPSNSVVGLVECHYDD
jgi:hypothetical protein